jgi:hypothetical protein
MKVIVTECKICGWKGSPRGISQHINKTHDLNVKDYLIKYEFEGETPKCKCGCGSETTIYGYDVRDYVLGHSPIGRFKKGTNPRKNIQEWKKNLTTGIRKYNQEAKKKDPEYRSGINNNFFGRTHTDSTKERIRNSVEIQISEGRHAFLGNNNGRIKGSSLEDSFERYIKSCGIIFERSYKVPYCMEDKTPRNKYYDFYIPIINTVIEIHGSYWHPKTNHNLSRLQTNNLQNDIFKKKLAKNNWFNILTIYDDELESFIKDDVLKDIIKNSLAHKIDLSYCGVVSKGNVIELPDYWVKLVDPDSITVQLTPIGKPQKLYIEDIRDNKIYISSDAVERIDCFYYVLAERVDVEKLQVEI